MAQRDWERLGDVSRRVNISPGGVALWQEPPSRLTDTTQPRLLNFEGVYANSLDGVSDRDFAIEFLCAASLIMVHLSRLSEEVISLVIRGI